MNNGFRLIPVFFAICLIVGCASTPKVFTDYDELQSFENYKSFSWISDTPMIVSGDYGPNPIVAQRLQNDILATLEQMGFQYVAEAENADFVVAFTVGARDKLDVQEREIVEYYGTHWRWGYNYYNIPNSRTEVITTQYAEGSLAIDIFDAERKSPVWHGSASKRLSNDEMDGVSAESTRLAVQTILAGFPPQ